MLFANVPLFPPDDPNHQRWQRFLKVAKLPSELRDIAPPLQPGDSYWVPIGSKFGLSAGNVQYPHHASGNLFEMPIDGVVEEGVRISCNFVSGWWTQERPNVTSTGHVRLEVGGYMTFPDGVKVWRVDRVVQVTEGLPIVISEEDVAKHGSTHLRIVHAAIRPGLVAAARQAPNWFPVYRAFMCVVGIE